MVMVSRGRFQAPREILKFVYARLARIYPPYWVYFFITLAVFLAMPEWVNSGYTRLNLWKSFLLIPDKTLFGNGRLVADLRDVVLSGIHLLRALPRTPFALDFGRLGLPDYLRQPHTRTVEPQPGSAYCLASLCDRVRHHGRLHRAVLLQPSE